MQQQIDNINKRIDQIAKESRKRAAQTSSAERAGEGNSLPNSANAVGGGHVVPFNDFDIEILRNKIELCVQ